MRLVNVYLFIYNAGGTDVVTKLRCQLLLTLLDVFTVNHKQVMCILNEGTLLVATNIPTVKMLLCCVIKMNIMFCD